MLEVQDYKNIGSHLFIFNISVLAHFWGLCSKGSLIFRLQSILFVWFWGDPTEHLLPEGFPGTGSDFLQMVMCVRISTFWPHLFSPTWRLPTRDERSGPNLAVAESFGFAFLPLYDWKQVSDQEEGENFLWCLLLDGFPLALPYLFFLEERVICRFGKECDYQLSLLCFVWAVTDLGCPLLGMGTWNTCCLFLFVALLRVSNWFSAFSTPFRVLICLFLVLFLWLVISCVGEEGKEK